MTETIQAERVTLYDLIDKFNFKLSENPAFFREWQDNLPEINEGEKQQLHRVKNNYFNLAMRPMVEDMVKMVVLSPLLDLAGFYLPPFYTTAESSIEIEERDKGLIIRGRIDVLVLKERFWVLVIESKRSGFSLEVGIPQCLAYMLGSPHAEKSLFGLVTNGSNFIFLKLVKGEQFEYALSDEFSLRRGDDLVTVLAILKRLKRGILS
ncbi:MAG: restriction endonuclease subunit R [Microcoleaceae cyanobacterium]